MFVSSARAALIHRHAAPRAMSVTAVAATERATFVSSSSSRVRAPRRRRAGRPARAAASEGDDIETERGREPRANVRVNARGSALRLENVERSPSFRLALFADCQYADKENQTRDDGSGRVKFFREAKRRLADAFDAFDARASELSGIVNLGDLFDGYNDDDKTTRPVLRGEMREETREKNRRDLSVVADIVNSSSTRVFHCIGNHDCSVTKRTFLSAVNATSMGEYYSVPMPRKWRLVILDTTDLNPRYVPADSSEYDAAFAFAKEAADNDREEIVPWGGGIGPTQFAWLESELKDAKEKEDRVIIASHNALHRDAARYQMSAWNSDAVSSLIEESGVVKICLAGHDHPGKYLYRHGVHYVTLEAMLEAKNNTSYAFLDVYQHEAILTGVGASTSRKMRVSPHGLFTGIATFGAETIGAIAGAGSDASVETSQMGLIEWINTRGRDAY